MLKGLGRYRDHQHTVETSQSALCCQVVRKDGCRNSHNVGGVGLYAEDLGDAFGMLIRD